MKISYDARGLAEPDAQAPNIAKIEGDQVILRHRGLTELVRVERADLLNPGRFRPANWS